MPNGKSSSGSSNDISSSLRAGVAAQQSLQTDTGYFPADYGGPMFLMPGLLITCYITGVLDAVLTPEHKREMIRYLENHQNEDGGIGLHFEGPSTMMGSSLKYGPPALTSTLHLCGMAGTVRPTPCHRAL